MALFRCGAGAGSSPLEFENMIFGDIIDDGIDVEANKDYFLFINAENSGRVNGINTNMDNGTGFTVIDRDITNPAAQLYLLMYKIHTTAAHISISNVGTGTTFAQTIVIPE